MSHSIQHAYRRWRRRSGSGLLRAAPLALGVSLLFGANCGAQGYGGYQGGDYGGYPAPPQGGYQQQPPSNYQPGGDANVSVRLDQLQQQLQDLTGRVEELNHQIQTLSNRLDSLNSAPPPGPQQTPPPSGGLYPNSAPSAGPADNGSGGGYDDYDNNPRQAYPPPAGSDYGPRSDAGGDNGPGAPPHNLGTLSLSSNGAQIPARAQPAAAGGPEAQYDQAIALLRSEKYPEAREGFKAFLQKYPSHALSGNAEYWLGETYYAQGQYRDAAESFLKGFQKYPKNAKAPASLLKLGMSLGQLKQTKEACLTLNEISKRYPESPLMLRQRADEERKRLRCS
jgi:tol-pal system protein YbgF